MRVSLFLVSLLISVGGFSQTGWNSFPKNDVKAQDTIIAKEGIVTDTMQVKKTDQPVSEQPGVVNITVSAEIVAIDMQLVEKAKTDPRINGFTILIFSGSGANSKLNAHNRQKQFKELFPDYVSHLTWKSPNYEVRVGDFRTKIEAEKILQEVKQKYPSAIVRADKIELPELEDSKPTR